MMVWESNRRDVSRTLELQANHRPYGATNRASLLISKWNMTDTENYNREAVRNVANACCAHTRAIVKLVNVSMEEMPDCHAEELLECRKVAFALIGQFSTIAKECSTCGAKRTGHH
jgi:hypothetical protein